MNYEVLWKCLFAALLGAGIGSAIWGVLANDTNEVLRGLMAIAAYRLIKSVPS